MQLHLQAQIDSSISTDPELIKDPEYQQVLTVLIEMARTGILQAAPGNCVAVSEMAQHLLWDQGIRSRLVECRLMTIRPTGSVQNLDWTFVGYNDGAGRGQIDTHVILIVECTKRSLLVDLSVQHLLPNARLWLCEQLGQGDEPDYIGHYQIEGHRYLYTVKKNPRLPELHQKSLVERIEQERVFKRSLHTLRWVLAAVAVFTLINFTLNSVQLYLRAQTYEEIRQFTK